MVAIVNGKKVQAAWKNDEYRADETGNVDMDEIERLPDGLFLDAPGE